MRIRLCPICRKAGLKWDGPDGKGYDGLTDQERYQRWAASHTNETPPEEVERWHMRYCPRCKAWVNAELTANYDQHKRR